MRADRFELRPLQPGSEHARGLHALFQEVYDRDLPPELLPWRYAPRAEGPPVIDVAMREDRLVAHLASLPVRLQRGGQSVIAGLWADLMVHPEHRDLTLFLDLAEAHLEHCRQAGIRLLFAFPNDRSYPVLKRMLDWKTIAEIVPLEAPLASLAPPSTLGRAGGELASGWNIAEISDFGEPFAAFWENVRPKDAWCGSRDPAWLRWRYARSSGRPYVLWSASDAGGRLAGWLAAKIFLGPKGLIADILDLWYADDGAVAPLLAAAHAYFSGKGKVDAVSAWALPGSPVHDRLTAWGLRPSGSATHFAGRWTAPEEPSPFPGNGRLWRISKGDSDVF